MYSRSMRQLRPWKGWVTYLQRGQFLTSIPCAFLVWPKIKAGNGQLFILQRGVSCQQVPLDPEETQNQAAPFGDICAGQRTMWASPSIYTQHGGFGCRFSPTC